MLQRCDSISPNYVWSDLRDLTWLTTTHNLDCISVFLRVKEQQVFAHSLPKHFLCCTAVAKITSSVYTLSYMLVNWSYLWAGVLQSDHNCFWHYVISRMTFWSFGLISERNSRYDLGLVLFWNVKSSVNTLSVLWAALFGCKLSKFGLVSHRRREAQGAIVKMIVFFFTLRMEVL